jgi:hypothetical protein
MDVTVCANLPHNAEGILAVAWMQRAQLLTQQPRQHRQHPLHQVPAELLQGAQQM